MQITNSSEVKGIIGLLGPEPTVRGKGRNRASLEARATPHTQTPSRATGTSPAPAPGAPVPCFRQAAPSLSCSLSKQKKVRAMNPQPVHNKTVSSSWRLLKAGGSRPARGPHGSRDERIGKGRRPRTMGRRHRSLRLLLRMDGEPGLRGPG